MTTRSANSDAARPITNYLSPFLAVLCFANAVMIEGMSTLFGFRTLAVEPWKVLLLILLCLALRLPPALRAAPWLMPFDALLAVAIVLDFTLIFPWQVQAFALPLVDDAMRDFDRLVLGFDHVTWMDWLNRHPAVTKLLIVSYRSMIAQVMLALVLCLLTGRARPLDRYLAAYTLGILLTSLASVLLPTRGIVVFLDPALRDTIGWPHGATDIAAYDALRSGVLRELSSVPQLGIISFPSFHATSAALSTWIFWGFRPLRGPAFALNATMSVATVGCGGHYVADVLGGYLVAAVAILLARRGSDLGYALVDRVVATSQRPATAPASLKRSSRS